MDQNGHGIGQDKSFPAKLTAVGFQDTCAEEIADRFPSCSGSTIECRFCQVAVIDVGEVVQKLIDKLEGESKNENR